MPGPLRVAVLVSGTGRTLDALATALPGVGAAVVLVVADRPGIPAAEVAQRHGLPFEVVPMRGRDPAELGHELETALTRTSAALVVLAGLRSILPNEVVARWSGRLVNVHPSLLPRHGGPGQYGDRVYASILASGDRESGATVHLVTPEVDAGPVVAQERFALAEGETVESLRRRTQPLERRLLVDVIARFADGRWPLPYDASAARRRERGPSTGGSAPGTPSAESGVG